MTGYYGSIVACARHTDKTPKRVNNIWPAMKAEMARQKALDEMAAQRLKAASRKERDLISEISQKFRMVDGVPEGVSFKVDRSDADIRVEVEKYKRIERRFLRLGGFHKRAIAEDCRGKEIVRVRMAIAYWAVRTCKLSLPKIGRLMDRDHTSVIHGARKWPIVREVRDGRHLRRVR